LIEEQMPTQQPKITKY